MSGGANIVEQYAGADVPARIELLIKYYPTLFAWWKAMSRA